MTADLAHPHHAQDLVVHLHAHEPLFFPLPCFHGNRRLRNFPRESKDHRQCMLCGRDRIASGRIHDDDATLGRRHSIHIVKA